MKIWLAGGKVGPARLAGRALFTANTMGSSASSVFSFATRTRIDKASLGRASNEAETIALRRPSRCWPFRLFVKYPSLLR